MDFLDIAIQIIPGYDSVSTKHRTRFEASVAGQQFVALVHKQLALVTTLNESLGWMELFFGNPAERKKHFQTQFNQEKKLLLEAMHLAESFEEITLIIVNNILNNEWDDFKLLSKKQQKILATQAFSKKLQEDIPNLNRIILQKQLELLEISKIEIMGWRQTTLEEELARLKNRKHSIISEWRRAFLVCPEGAPLLSNIAKRHQLNEIICAERQLNLLDKHIQQLANFFPLLARPKSTGEQTIGDQIFVEYGLDDGKLALETAAVDEKYLIDTLFFCLQKSTQIEIPFIHLDNFNRKHAQDIARVVLTSFNKRTHLDIDRELVIYAEELYTYITEQLRLIRGRRFQPMVNEAHAGLLHSLSFLFHNKAVDAVGRFAKKLGDAHAFIQATGFSTQNESSFLAILDVYNYGRHYERIAKAKTIITSLLAPLESLYNEYRDIGLYEKNQYWKVVRIFMPLFIAVVFIALASVLLAPLPLSSFAAAAVFLPTLLIALGLSAKYCTVKNTVFKRLRENFYGGTYEIPEFQVNERMIAAFHNVKNARFVRKMYTEELTRCDTREANFSEKHAKGILTQAEITERQENLDRRHTLCLEWYDIHSNKDLGYTDLPRLVLSRLQAESNHEYQILEHVLQEERPTIRSSLLQVTSDIKVLLCQSGAPAAILQDRNLVSIDTLISRGCRQGLFSSPRCLINKTRMEEMADFTEQMTVQG